MDYSRIVTLIGSHVTRLKIGNAKFKQSGASGQAVVRKDTFRARKPDSISFEDAACLGTLGVTDRNGLVDKAKLRPGQFESINGCAGAVGEAAVQIAQVLGATVSGSSNAHDVELARSFGIKTVHDYNTTDLSHIADHFDVVYDTAAALTLSDGMRMLSRGGVFLDLKPWLGKFIRAAFDRRLKPIIGSHRRKFLEKIVAAGDEGKFEILSGKTVSLDSAIPLVSELERGRQLGGFGVATE